MRNIQKVIASGISLAMAATMCVAVPATSAFAAEGAGTTAAEGENAELLDINDVISPKLKVGDQLFMNELVKPLSGKLAAKYNTLDDTKPLTEGVDYEVVYENNDKLGAAKATLTGIGAYTGTKTYDFNIIEFSITVTYKNEAGETKTLGALDYAHVQKLMAESTDNTKAQYYQYGTTNAYVNYVPAKSYLTYDSIMREVGVTGWKNTVGYATDGFASNPITSTINDNGMFFPAQTTSSMSAEGAYHVPAIITTAYSSAPIETTAAAAAKVAASKDLQKEVKLFSGILKDEFTSSDSSVVDTALSGKRFATGINVFAIDSYTPLKANPITVSASKKTVKNNAKQTVKLTVKKAQGKVTYSVKSAPSKKAVKVSSKGVVTIAKGAKTGKYVINVKAAGNKNYKAKTKTVTIKVTK